MRYQSDDGPNRLTSTAFGVNLGTGYDVPISRSISLTPFVSAFVASFGSGIKFNGDPVRDDVGLMVIQAGVGVSWY